MSVCLCVCVRVQVLLKVRKDVNPCMLQRISGRKAAVQHPELFAVKPVKRFGFSSFDRAPCDSLSACPVRAQAAPAGTAQGSWLSGFSPGFVCIAPGLCGEGRRFLGVEGLMIRLLGRHVSRWPQSRSLLVNALHPNL